MSTVHLVGGTRTPTGRYGGALAPVRPDDLAALVLGETAERAGLDPESIDHVVLGAANQSGEDNRNVARMASLLAGWPAEVPGMTVNRLCASGLSAVATGAAMIRSGEADVVVAGGVESMTRAPWVTPKPSAAWQRPETTWDTSLGWRMTNPRMAGLDGGEATISLGETAEKVATRYGITRAECDEWALASQERANAAHNAGHFAQETVAVAVPQARGADQLVRADETLRPGTTLETLAALRPSFRPDGVVTAGNASPLSDGASAIVLASDAALQRLGLASRATITGFAAVGCPPSVMGLGPVPAVTKLLSRLGLGLADIDTIELNEAFAAQVLACVRDLDLDTRRVNEGGGAIALGHALGSSGSRLLVTMLGRMERTGAGRGLVTMCVGVGQGVAMVVERHP